MYILKPCKFLRHVLQFMKKYYEGEAATKALFGKSNKLVYSLLFEKKRCVWWRVFLNSL
jgi:hypothetical protein